MSCELRFHGAFVLSGQAVQWAEDERTAMKASIADHVWSIEEIVGLLG